MGSQYASGEQSQGTKKHWNCHTAWYSIQVPTGDTSEVMTNFIFNLSISSLHTLRNRSHDWKRLRRSRETLREL